MNALTWKILGELCIRIAWKVEATPIPIMPSRECRWSAFIVLLSSSEVFSNDEFSIMTKHLKNKLQLNAQWIQSNLQWGPLLYNGHFFGGESIHWLLFKTLYNGHFRLSQRWSLWRGSMVVSFSFWNSSAVIKNITLGKFVWIWQFTFQTDVFATLIAQKLDLSYSLAIIKWL